MSTFKRFCLAVGSIVLYASIFVPAHSVTGSMTGMLTALPAVAVGWLLGLRAGLLFGLLGIPMNILLYTIAGDPLAHELAPHVLGGIALSGVGVVFGWHRGLLERISEQARLLEEERATLQGEIVKRQRAEEALRESEERYALATRGANDGLWDWDLRTNLFYYSARWKAMIGYAEDQIGNRADEWFDRVHPEDQDRVRSEVSAYLARLTDHFECEHRIRHKDGSYRWIISRGLAVRDTSGSPYRMAGSLSDINRRKSAEEQLLHDTFHDALTGLPNRALFMDRLGRALEHAKRSKERMSAVLYLDVDRFTVVNDTLGHMLGDQLLSECARRLETVVYGVDTVARLGGDEFAILLEDIGDKKVVTDVADRIKSELGLPFNLGGHRVFNSASIGIVCSTTDYENAEDIVRDAGIAMSRAKALGKARYEVFDRELGDRVVARLEVEAGLRGAIERDEFRIHYQPILTMADRNVIGFEALVRWQHPERGLLSPAEFIPIAEETGLIIPIGQWVLREACRQTREWQTRFPTNPPLTISVNLSAKQLAQPDLVPQIVQVLGETQVAPGSLRLEITESMIVEDTEAVATILERLRAAGVGIHIDDFGTGYSALGYLHRLPIDALKIDRSFVSKLATNNNSSEIVRTILSLAYDLGLKVIAEGVETTDQLVRLKQLGCEYGQGYLFGKPQEELAAGALIAASFVPGQLSLRAQLPHVDPALGFPLAALDRVRVKDTVDSGEPERLRQFPKDTGLFALEHLYPFSPNWGEASTRALHVSNLFLGLPRMMG